MISRRPALSIALSVATAIALCVPSPSGAAVTSGLLLTNFISATFALPDGTGVSSSDPGISPINIHQSASSWVIFGGSPVLCMQGWKVPLADPYGTRLPPPGTRAPGDLLCFEIGFSNCGDATGWSVHITDVLPANVVKTPALPGSVWVAGGYGGSISTPWAKDLGGPWETTSNAGQVAPMYMRWIMARVGMHKSGYVRYCVTVL